MDFPERVAKHIADGGIIRAHNAQFERIMWRDCAVPKYGFPETDLEQFECSAAEAAAMALPRSLGECARVTGVDVQKDTEGYNLMMRMCRPRSVTVMPDKSVKLTWWDVPDRVARLIAYCKQDVKTEQAISKVLRRLSDDEREVYLLDQRVNDRGFGLDVPLIQNLKLLADEGIDRANADLAELTGGDVTAVSQSGRLTAWLNANGTLTDSVDKAAVQEMLVRDGLEPTVRKVLEIRAAAGRSSVAKLDTMLEYDCDGRAKGTLLFHGAGTGRWSGKGPQPQNLPRGDVPNAERFIHFIKGSPTTAYQYVSLFENPIAVVSSLVRACIVPASGNVFVGGDFAAIEARVLVWLAGQQDVLDMFRRNEDVYVAMAAKLFSISAENVDKHQRQTGKFAVLGCGYGMGAEKGKDTAKTMFNLDIEVDEMQRIINTYRSANPMVVNFWHEANRAAIAACETPGVPVTFGHLRNLKFLKAGAYLWLQLPSGRLLSYPAGRVVMAPTPWGEERPAVEFMGVDSYTRKWGAQRLYGGLIVENIVQAVSRDLMVFAMQEAEAFRFKVVLTVHDELLTELPQDSALTAYDLQTIMSAPPTWAMSLPLRAETWSGERYQK
jgi:DNA polymerase